ncbi:MULTISPECIES: hypothetical protein [Pseudomonas]|uniref:hypothetical protein n=1 Tax=Pseudomonas TaxID=286 RepID=UPI000CFD547C|nr:MULTISPECIES: hypothetical protein [Pseudomonas]PQZ92656.1 hypothetical protein CQ048_09055 [Pseudomonas trivialis]PRB26540.1 hypothetical protein CQ041_12355 [Pseudomonas sp. MYb60]
MKHSFRHISVLRVKVSDFTDAVYDGANNVELTADCTSTSTASRVLPADLHREIAPYSPTLAQPMAYPLGCPPALMAYRRDGTAGQGTLVSTTTVNITHN